MQDHSYAFEVDATPQEIWALFWGHRKRRVHRFISKDNDQFMKSAIEKGVHAMRARRSA